MNSEHYIDEEHNDGIFNSYNLASYSYCYQNPVRYVDPNGKQVDIIDFIPFIGSARDIYRGTRDGDMTTLGIGIAGLALDCGTLGAVSIAKGISKAAIKQSIKVIADASAKQIIKEVAFKMTKREMAAAIKELGLDAAKKYTAKELFDLGAKYSAKYYRHNLQVFTGLLEAAGKDAHHIFPKAEKFAEFFSKAGIDVNNPANMRWLEETIHRGKNSAEHLTEWTNVMKDFAKKRTEPTIELLQKEAKRIEKIFK